jgi:hypothetical protein
MMPATESLAARAEKLLNRLAQVHAQRADLEARTEVVTAQARASRTREVLEDVQRVIPILAENGVASPAVSEAMRGEAVKARTALRSTATSIVGAPLRDIASRIHSQSVNSALEVGDKLAKSLVADINRSVDKKRLEILPDGIDQRIVIYPGASDLLAVRLQGIQGRLQRKVDGLGPSELEQRFRDIIRDTAAWMTDRPRLEASLENQHPDVRELLRQAATEDGASWSLITPAVQTWLADPENSTTLRIVLRS